VSARLRGIWAATACAGAGRRASGGSKETGGHAVLASTGRPGVRALCKPLWFISIPALPCTAAVF